MSRLVIYTDLDGSLLDHHDYSHAPADPLLQELEQVGVPVIPCTSKTRAELLPLRDELHNAHPFIVENGAAVYMPSGYFPHRPKDTEANGAFWVKQFVQPRTHWLDLIHSLPNGLADRFTAFSDMSVQRIVELTGLSEAAAQRAAQREFGEPLHWHDAATDPRELIAALHERGARVLRGGRFLHVSGECDKGSALQWLHRIFQAHAAKAPVYSLAIGDSHNDIAMLEAADHALVIRSPAHRPPLLRRQHNISISALNGPAGWNAGVRQVLEKLSLSRR
jgi:mannosyl-3-phosphoglycerate phosphatase family protein